MSAANLVFRVDASTHIGTGHVVRCLTLASELRDRDFRCSFVCREHAGNLIEQIRQHGYPVHVLPSAASQVEQAESADDPQVAHAAWLGCDWATDAEQTLRALGDEKFDWLVVDHYGLDARWERRLRVVRERVMVIDDLADREHDCELLLDQGWHGASTDTRYDSLVPPHCVRLTGPRHALLMPEFRQARAMMPPRDGSVRRVLVFLGGSDPANQTARVIAALTRPALADLAVDVVVGVNHPDPAGIAALVAARPATRLHQNLPSLAGLMSRSDLMIGAGGGTTWERMFLGLPGIVISLARNQTPASTALMDAGYTTFLGEMSVVTEADIASAVLSAVAHADQLRRQSERMQLLVQAIDLEQLRGYLMAARTGDVAAPA